MEINRKLLLKSGTLFGLWHSNYIAPPTDQGLQIHHLKILEPFWPQMHFFFLSSWSNWLHEKLYAKLNGCHLGLLLSSIHRNVSTLLNGFHVENQPMKDLHVNLGSTTNEETKKKSCLEDQWENTWQQTSWWTCCKRHRRRRSRI